MAKIDLKRPKKAPEVKIEPSEDSASQRDSGDEEEAAPARPAAAEQRRARMRERRIAAAATSHTSADHDPPAHGHGHGEDDHGGHDPEEEIDHSNDPTWWVPHAVLGTLVLVGILGFFGTFNSIAAKLGYPGIDGLAAPAETAAPKPATEPPKAPETRPQPMPRPANMPPGETYGAKHLLVMHKESMRVPPTITRTKEEAKARAEEALKKLRGGAKFEDIVKEYSDDATTAARGGDLGTFAKGRMVPQFTEGLEKTKVGGISDLVESPFGYHIILRTQ